MIPIVLDLQRDALDRSVAISDLLRKALVVARKLDLPDFEAHIGKELNGYVDRATIPGYREVRGVVKAFNPYGGWQTIHFEDTAEQKLLSVRKCNQPVAELEALIGGKETRSELGMPFAEDVQRSLRRAIGLQTDITLIVPRAKLIQILDSVRTFVLNWTLRLEQDGVLGEDMSFTKNEKAVAAAASSSVNHFYGNVQGMIVQQGLENQLTVAVNIDPGKVAEFIAELKLATVALGLDGDGERELCCEIATVEAQLASPRFKGKIVAEALASIRHVLENAAGGVASGLVAKLVGLA